MTASTMNPSAGIANKLGAFKQFCIRVWALSAPYFRSEDKWKARGLLAAIVVPRVSDHPL